MTHEHPEAFEYAAAAPELERAATPAMDPTALTALQGAIAKWELMATDDETAIAKGRAIKCQLCVLFNPPASTQPDDCVGCPIYAETGQKYCDGTPYNEWADANTDEDYERRQAAAGNEVEFLKSLLPVTP